jgi:hypothetical protein
VAPSPVPVPTDHTARTDFRGSGQTRRACPNWFASRKKPIIGLRHPAGRLRREAVETALEIALLGGRLQGHRLFEKAGRSERG